MLKVLIIDTSILSVWLKIDWMDHAGPGNDLWNFDRIDAKIKDEVNENTTLVLPLATIIETGNHIANSTGDRYNLALCLCELIKNTANNQTPWAAFTVQNSLWEKENLISLATKWPHLAASKLSLGDATITEVASYYSKMRYKVEIFTGDLGLKAYEPQPTLSQNIPRRSR